MTNQERSALRDELFGKKRKLWLWFSTPTSPLKLSAMMVYGYRVYQSEYETIVPRVRKVAKATGLSKATITNADQQLLDVGLLDSDRCVIQPPEGWFVQKKKETIAKLGDRHWRHRYSNWELYIRHPNSQITHVQAALLSLLWHCFATNFEPREGWSVSYLATILRCRWETVREALRVLEVRGALKFKITKDDGLTFSVRRLSESQLAWFQEAGSHDFVQKDCSIGYCDEIVADTSGVRGPPKTTVDTLANSLRGNGIKYELAREYAAAIVDSADWDTYWHEISLYIHRRLELLRKPERIPAIEELVKQANDGILQKMVLDSKGV